MFILLILRMKEKEKGRGREEGWKGRKGRRKGGRKEGAMHGLIILVCYETRIIIN